MTLAPTNVLATGSSTPATSFTTASVSPAARTLLLLSVGARTSSGSPSTPTVSGLGLTWTRVGSPAVINQRKLALFAALTGKTAPSAGTITIDFGTTSITTCGWVLDTVAGAAGVRNPSVATATATSVTATYPNAFADGTNDVGYAAVLATGGSVTPRSSPAWTELADTNAGSTLGYNVETQFFVGSDTAASGSRGSSTTWAIAAIEIQPRTAHDLVTIGSDAEHSLSGQVLSGVDATTTQKGHVTIGATAPPAIGTAAAGAATTEAASKNHVHATGAGTPTTSAVGDAAATGSGPAAAMTNHVHGRESFGSSAAAIGTSAAGSATTPSRSDHVHATGAGTPSTQAFGDAAATGTGPAAAMTDHKHAMPADPVTAHAAAADPHTGYVLESLLDAKGDIIAASADNTPAKVTVGADDTILMADSAQTAGVKWVASQTPSTQAFGDAAAQGTADTYARGDHKHAMPATPTQQYQISFSKSGNLSTSTGAFRWYNDTGKTLTFNKVRASAGTAPTTQSILCDVNVDGTTIWSTQGNRVAVGAGANTGTQTSFDTTTVSDGHYVTVDVDQVGSGTVGADLLVTVWMTG